VSQVVSEGQSAMVLRHVIDDYSGGLPPRMTQTARSTLKEIVERRLDEAVTRTLVAGKYAGQTELDLLEAALNDRYASDPEPQLVEIATSTHANLHTQLLVQEGTTLDDPQSPRGIDVSQPASLRRVRTQVELLVGYLKSDYLTPTSKAEALAGLQKLVIADPVTVSGGRASNGEFLSMFVLEAIPGVMKEPDENVQIRAYSVLVELMLGQAAIRACSYCLKGLCIARPNLRRLRDKFAKSETAAFLAFRKILDVALNLFQQQTASGLHSGVSAAVTVFARMVKYKTIRRKLFLTRFPKLLSKAETAYSRPVAETDPKYASSILLRIRELQYAMKLGQKSLADAIAIFEKPVGLPSVLEKTLMVWHQRAGPLPLLELVDRFNAHPAMFPH